jgi:hypothetical protein
MSWFASCFSGDSTIMRIIDSVFDALTCTQPEGIIAFNPRLHQLSPPRHTERYETPAKLKRDDEFNRNVVLQSYQAGKLTN